VKSYFVQRCILGLMHAGVFNAMAIVGPALGYVFGALSLKVFTDFYILNSDE